MISAISMLPNSWALLCTTICVPVLLQAPSLFSTTKVWSSRSERRWQSSRDSTSVASPGVQGTTHLDTLAHKGRGEASRSASLPCYRKNRTGLHADPAGLVKDR